MSDDKTDPPLSMEDLAKEYMDLWRDQLQGMAEDPDVNTALAQTMQMMNAGFTSFTAASEAAMAGVKAASEEGNKAQHDEHGQTGTEGGNGRLNGEAQATGATHGAPDPLVLELESRIAELERRVAALEAKPKSSRRSPRKKTR